MKKALQLYQETSLSVEEICRLTGLSKSYFYRHKPKELQRGHCNKNRKYSFSLESFLEESEEKYYWLGFIAADGSVVKNSLSIELSERDVLHLVKFNTWCKNNSPITTRTNNGGHKAVKTQIHSKELVELLLEYNIVPNKTNIVSMSKIPKKFKISFIRGYIDGDGTISMKGNQIYFSIVSGSLEMIKEIELCLQTGNKINCYGTYYKLACLGNKKALNILKKIYKDSTEASRLDRKYNNYLGVGPSLSD